MTTRCRLFTWLLQKPCSILKKKDHGKGFQIEHLFTTSQFLQESLLIFLLPEANEEEQQSTHQHTEMSYPLV
jgi:hypothetical protein